MNKNLRKAVIAGNCKMNNTRPEAKALIEELKPMVADAGCGVVICVPYTNLETALALTEGTNIGVGAENCHWEKSGAFTGEISQWQFSAPTPMLVPSVSASAVSRLV